MDNKIGLNREIAILTQIQSFGRPIFKKKKNISTAK